jgi:DNA/RNA-binding domain of Phe-tRNA-synthetase-like protein
MELTDGILAMFPGITVVEGTIRFITRIKENSGLNVLREEIVREIRSRYTLEQVKDDPLFRAYRDFFWSVGVDPTKTRPASEALVRRILSGKDLPEINPVVDTYNLASAKSGVPIAAFDADRLHGDLTMRFAHEGEEFLGIGMKEPVLLRKNQVVITDGEGIIAVYPYRDSDATKVTNDTRNVHLVTCGVPGVGRETVVEAYTLCAQFLEQYAGGMASDPIVSPEK